MGVPNPIAIFGGSLVAWTTGQITGSSNAFTPSTNATWNDTPQPSFADNSGNGVTLTAQSNAWTLELLRVDNTNGGFPSSGVFTLSVSVNGGEFQTTAAISANGPSSATIQSALQALGNVGASNMTVGTMTLFNDGFGNYCVISPAASLASATVIIACNFESISTPGTVVIYPGNVPGNSATAAGYPTAVSNPPSIGFISANAGQPPIVLFSPSITSVAQNSFICEMVIRRPGIHGNGTATGECLVEGNNGNLFMEIYHPGNSLIVGANSPAGVKVGNVSDFCVVGYWSDGTLAGSGIRVGNQTYPFAHYNGTTGGDTSFSIGNFINNFLAQFYGLVQEFVCAKGAQSSNEPALYKWFVANNAINIAPTANVVVIGSSLESAVGYQLQPQSDWPHQITCLKGQNFYSFAISGFHMANSDLNFTPNDQNANYHPLGQASTAQQNNVLILGAPYNDFSTNSVTTAAQMWNGVLSTTLFFFSPPSTGAITLSVYTLTGGVQTCAPISCATISTTTIAAALNANTNLEGGSFTVTGSGTSGSPYTITPSGFPQGVVSVSLVATTANQTPQFTPGANFLTIIKAAQTAGFNIIATPTITQRQGAQGSYPGCADSGKNALFAAWNALATANASAVGLIMIPIDQDTRTNNSMSSTMWQNPDTGGIFGRHPSEFGTPLWAQQADLVLAPILSGTGGPISTPLNYGNFLAGSQSLTYGNFQ